MALSSKALVGLRFSTSLNKKGWGYYKAIRTLASVMKFVQNKQIEWGEIPITITANCIDSRSILDDGSICSSIDVELKVSDVDTDGYKDEATRISLGSILGLFSREIKSVLSGTSVHIDGAMFFDTTDITTPIIINGRSKDLWLDYRKYLGELKRERNSENKGGNTK